MEDEEFPSESMLAKEVAYLMGRDEEQKFRREVIKEKKKKTLKPTTGFVKLHKSIMVKVREHMFTTAEKALLFDLIPFCNIETNVVTDEDGLPMTQSDIIELLGYDKKYVQGILGKLLEKNVIIKISKGKNVYYKLSDEYCG